MDDDYAYMKLMEQSILDEIEIGKRPEKVEQLVHDQKPIKVIDQENDRNMYPIENGETVPNDVESVSTCIDEILENLFPLSHSNPAPSNSPPATELHTSALVAPEHQPAEYSSSQRLNKSESLENLESDESGVVVYFMDREDLSQAVADQVSEKVSIHLPIFTDTAASKSKNSSEDLVSGPLVCRFCGKLVDNWWSHLRDQHRHSSHRQWFCAHCPKSYKSGQGLRHHYEAVHCLIKYRCKKCSRQFKYASTALLHSQRKDCDH